MGLKEKCLINCYNEYMDEFLGREIVLGCGNADTSLLLIGEAPGRDEVRLSKPFVGKAGKQLDEFLEQLGVEKNSIYITNAIKFRLSKTDPKTGRMSNRPATRDEINQNRRYLLKEIDIIRPTYIVTLGNVPLKAATGNFGINIGSLHGETSDLNILDRNYKLFALYHPASIIYNRSLMDIYINDLKKLKCLICEGK